MKKTYKKVLLGALLAAFALSATALTGCKGGNESTPDNSSDNSTVSAVLELSKTSAGMVLGDELLLIALCDNSNAVTWESNNPSIATVSSEGVVTALEVGEATITATYEKDGKIYTESCQITVGFGNLQPTLVLKSYLDEELVTFTAGIGYALNAVVSFNGIEYPCETVVEIDGDDTIIYQDGRINATGEGKATVTISAVWKGIESQLLTTKIQVEALRSVFITPFVTYAGETERVATNEMELSIVDEWCGKNYVTSAFVEFLADVEGQESILTNVSILEGSELITYDGATGEISAIQNRRGVAVLRAIYETDGKEYARDLTINVTCPIEEYTEFVELDMSKAFPAELFGAGAAVREAYQSGKNVSPASGRKQLVGVQSNGYETEAIEVYTTNGGYRFTNLYVYDMMLTQSNFASELSLVGKKSVNSSYYALASDVTVDMSSQAAGGATAHFAGVFDGREYTVNAVVGANGIFGHVGGDAVIKNTHFNFTFQEGVYAVGLAKNSEIAAMETVAVKDDSLRMDIRLENLYVTSTNYTATSYALMGEAPYFLTMQDVYVNVNVGTETPGARSERAALFHADKAIYMSLPAGQHHITAYKNVHVVTGALVAMADLAYTSLAGHPFAFTTWADNDISKIGAARRSTTAGTAEYMKLKPLKETEEFLAQYGKYYTYDGHASNPPKGACMAWTYIGVSRYDTVAQLTDTGVTKIGSWTVA